MINNKNPSIPPIPEHLQAIIDDQPVTPVEEQMNWPKFVVVFITPEHAGRLLSKMAKNRGITQIKLKAFKQKILDALFRLIPQPVILGTDGLLYDGQTRLTACVESGVGVWCVVAYNFNPDYKSDIDAGSSRGNADKINIELGVANGRSINAWANVNAFIRLPGTSYAHVDVATAIRWRNLNLASIVWGERMIAISKETKDLKVTAPMLGALVFAHKTSARQVNHIAQRFIQGSELRANTPLHSLRRAVVVAQSTGVEEAGVKDRVILARLVITAVHAEMNDRKTGKLEPNPVAIDFFRAVHDRELPLEALRFNG